MSMSLSVIFGFQLFGKKKQGNILLALCYVYFPLINIFSNIFDFNFLRNSIDFALLMLGLFSILILLVRNVENNNIKAKFYFSMHIILYLLLWILIGCFFGFSPLTTALMEAKPLIYLLIALLIMASRLNPMAIDFCRYGSILSVVLISESIIRSIASRSLARPVGSGEVNYDAALIILSLIFSLGTKDLFNRFAPLLLLGILASFSRTSLLVACVIFLIVDFIPMKYRFVAIAAASIAIFSSFAIRGLELNSLENMDRYWMWVSGIDYISNDFISSAVMFAPGSSLDINVPLYVEELWLSQQDAIGIEGIYPFHLHAFWLRILVSWGWLPVLVVLFFAFLKYTKKNSGIDVKSYILACIILGLTMGLFYLSNVSIPYFLAGLILLDKKYNSDKI